MMKRIESSDLGIQNCNFSASGETAGEIVKEVVEHLRDEHDIDMPDVADILEGKVSEDLKHNNPSAYLVVERLIETLNILPSEGPGKPSPSIGKSVSR
jgi:predicted small metal-binding protein